MKKFLNTAKVSILVAILNISDSISARIRRNLGFYDVARRPIAVINVRSFRSGRVPYRGPRTVSRRKSPLSVQFEGGDDDEGLR